MRFASVGMILALFLSLLATGCSGGGGSEAGTAVGGSSGTALLGRAQTDAPVAGAVARAVGPDGALLSGASIITDRFGDFSLEIAGTQDFRVEVTPSASAAGALPTWRAEVRGFGPQSGMVVVNAVTTLISLHMERHPELGPAEAEAEVKAFLGIPEAASVQTLEESPSSPFSHAAFLEAAAGSGGVPAYCQALLAELELGGFHPFVQAVSHADVLHFFEDCGKDLAKDYITDGGSQLIGWVTHGMGINYSFTTLGQIVDLLESLDGKLDQLQATVDRDQKVNDFTKARDQLYQDVVNPVQAATETLQSYAAQRQAHPVTSPVPLGTLSDDGNALVTALNSFRTTQILDDLVVQLEGTPLRRPLSQLYAPLLLHDMGIDTDPARYRGYGVRSNKILREAAQILEFYLGQMELCFNLVVENAHASPQLAVDIRRAQVVYAQTAASKKRILQQLPEPLPSELVIVDLEAGKVWYAVGQDQKTWSDAESFASRFPGTGPYTDGWRLPWDYEVQGLYERVKAGKAESGAKQSSVLDRMGFDLSALAPNNRVWCLGSSVAEYGLRFRFSLDTGEKVYQAFTEHNNFLLVREYPGTAEKDTSQVLPLSDLTPTSLAIEQRSVLGAGQGVQLDAFADFESRYGGSYTIGGKSFSTSYHKHDPITHRSVTASVAWTSSDDTMASVSNDTGTSGLLVWHYQPSGRALAPVTVRAELYGLTAELLVQPPANLPAAPLVSIQVTPYNAKFPTPTGPLQQDFGATLFYEDPVTGDRTVQDFAEDGAPALTWTLLDAATQAAIHSPTEGGFLSSDPNGANRLFLYPGLTASSLIVRASVGSVVGQAPLDVPLVP